MELPRRGEVLAVCAVAILLAHVLLAQLTLVLAVVFAVGGKASRWRLSWLFAPAVAGLAWTLLVGPDKALAGFAAGPSGILWHLGGGHLAGEAGHPFAGFAGAQGWLPRQFPVALITGAAEAALVGWLDWLHTDEWAVPPPRPGLIAAARRAYATNAIRTGAVLTRDGCALGVVPSTGAIAELRWAEVACGTLVVGTAAQDVALTGLQVVHAALRRRKPVIVLDHGDEVIARAVATACRAAGTPLLTDGAPDAPDPVQFPGTAGGTAGMEGPGVSRAGPSQLWGRGTSQHTEPVDRAESRTRPADQPTVDLGRVVRERLAALVLADSEEPTSRSCARLSSLAADLRRIGVDGDAIVWVPHGERVTAQPLAALLRDGPDVGLSLLIGTTSPAAAAELSGLTGSTLIRRVTDRDLAADLAARTGTRLLPASIAAALADQRPATGGPGPTAPAPDLVPSPVLPARALLALGTTEFALAVSSPRQRLVAVGRMVPACLPRAGRPRAAGLETVT
ncbi:MAG: hypothetical protein ACRDNW_16045 [Trebonia sp.]